MGYGVASGFVTGALTGAISYHIDDEYAWGVDKNVAPSVVLFEKHLFAASFLVLIFSKKAGFSLTKVNKVADSVQHSH